MYSTENKTSANDATKSSGKIITFDTKHEPEAYNVVGPSKAKKAKRRPKREEPYKEEKKGGGEL